MGTTGPGAAPDNLLRWMAKRAGLDSNRDVRLVPIQGGGPGMVAGLQQSVIDGFCLSSPTADLAVQRAGCAYLFDMAANPPPEFDPFCYIVASTAERTLGTKRDALTRYVMGITLALRSIKADPDRFRAFAVPYLELDPAIADRAFSSNGRIYFTDPVPNDTLFPPQHRVPQRLPRRPGRGPAPQGPRLRQPVRHHHRHRGGETAGLMISVQGVRKAYVARGQERLALDRVDLEIAAGEFIAFVGPSGCGKSTLMNMIAGILPITEGRILHDGRPVSGINRHVGYMTQADAVLPWRTVHQNIELPLRFHKSPDRAGRVDAMLAKVGLQGFGHAYPAELSGGMRKRVALAQLLAYEPGTLLMDEPFGALDAQLKLVMQEQLLQIWTERRQTVVFVTHDLAEAVTLAQRVVVFSGRPAASRPSRPSTSPTPRDPFRTRFDSAFEAAYTKLWDALAPEIRQGEAGMSGIADEAAAMAGGRTQAVLALESAETAHRIRILVLRILVGVGFLALWYVASAAGSTRC